MSDDEQAALHQRILGRVAAAHGIGDGKERAISTEVIFNFGAALRAELEAVGASWPQIEFVGATVIGGFEFPSDEAMDVTIEAFLLGFRVEAQSLDGTSLRGWSLKDESFTLVDLKKPN